MKKICWLTIVCVLLGAMAWGGDYRFVSAGDLKHKLESKVDLVLVDIQVEDEFAQHHIEGAVATYAYPVQAESDLKKLDAALAQLKTNEKPVVIVCPRGGGGAKRTYDYLKMQGVAEERLAILEGGQQDWPY